jgi:putative MATE family efflux protein
VLGANGYDATTQQFTKQYLTIILAGIPFYMFTSCSSSIIRADGSPKYSMLSTVIGAIINLIFDPIFIFACNMGVQGAALATIIGQVVSAVICLAYFRKIKLVKLSKDSFKLSGKVIGKTLKLGISSFITQIAIAIITIVANNVVGAIGGENATDAGAALGIVFKVFAIVIAFSLGIAVGAQPIIGYNYGAKKYQRVREAFKLVLLCNLILGIIATLLFEFAPSAIVSLFGSGTEFYKNYANLCFRIYLGGILLCCLQKASCTLLQSIDKPYKAMLLSLTRDVVLLVPGVCILGLCGDLYTMLWAGIIADVGSFIPTIIFVLMEMKKLKKQSQIEVKIPANMQKIESNNFVITIDREFGSGGKYIGQELAKRFGIKCYDNSLVTKVAEEYNVDLETLKSVDEKQKSSFWYGFATNYVFDEKQNQVMPISPEDNLFLKQCRTIEELYQNESCIIIGRCADFILKDKPNVIKLFVYSSSLQFKIERKSKFENCTVEETAENIKRIDKQRAEYYKHFTSQTWGEISNYDLCVETSKLGVEKSVDIIEDYIKSWLGVNGKTAKSK